MRKNKGFENVPVIILSAVIALLAPWLECLMPIHFIDADDNGVAYILSATFLFDMKMGIV